MQILVSRAFVSSFTQGQIVEENKHNSTREYFYHLDHQGQVISFFFLIFNFYKLSNHQFVSTKKSYFWKTQKLKTLQVVIKVNCLPFENLI